MENVPDWEMELVPPAAEAQSPTTGPLGSKEPLKCGLTVISSGSCDSSVYSYLYKSTAYWNGPVEGVLVVDSALPRFSAAASFCYNLVVFRVFFKFLVPLCGSHGIWFLPRDKPRTPLIGSAEPKPARLPWFPGASLVLSLGSADLGLNSVLPPFIRFISVGV